MSFDFSWTESFGLGSVREPWIVQRTWIAWLLALSKITEGSWFSCATIFPLSSHKFLVLSKLFLVLFSATQVPQKLPINGNCWDITTDLEHPLGTKNERWNWEASVSFDFSWTDSFGLGSVREPWLFQGTLFVLPNFSLEVLVLSKLCFVLLVLFRYPIFPKH